MLFTDFEDLMREACPVGRQLVFAVLANGAPPNLSIRFSGDSGKSIIEKFLTSVKTEGRLRDLVNAGSTRTETKVLFQFLGLSEKGRSSLFRRRWYAKYLDLAERVHGRGHTSLELLRLPPDRTIQFQVTLTLDTLEITDFKISKILESLIDSPMKLTQTMHDVNRANMPNQVPDLMHGNRYLNY